MLFVMGVRGSSLVEDEGQVRRGWVDEGWVQVESNILRSRVRVPDQVQMKSQGSDPVNVQCMLGGMLLSWPSSFLPFLIIFSWRKCIFKCGRG